MKIAVVSAVVGLLIVGATVLVAVQPVPSAAETGGSGSVNGPVTFRCIAWLTDGRCAGYGNSAFISQGISSAPPPKCDDGWALLTYPGTSLSVCARELRSPR